MAVAVPSNVHATGGYQDDEFPPIEELWVSHCVLAQLGISPGEQTEVAAAFVQKDHHDLFVSAGICIAKKLGYYYFRIAKDDEPQGTKGFVFYFKLDSSEDVNKLQGPMWYFWAECINFCRVKKLTVLESYDEIERLGCPREVA